MLRSLATLAVLAAACFVPRAALAQVFSPGKLSRAHAAFESRCPSCHDRANKAKVSASLCYSCHQPLRRRVSARRGYHGRRNVAKCASCHREHRGRGFALVKWPSGSAARFNHAQAGYALRGKHATTACRKCHSTAQQREADVRKMGAARRKRTYFGLKRGCVNCHTDHHNGALGTRCQTCHVQTSFKTVSRFPGHNKTHFPLRGKHAKIACKSCHKSPSGRWRFQNVPHATCNSCHTTAHPQTMGQKRGTVGRRCSSCHKETSFRAIIYARSTHSKKMPLVGGHRRARCRGCHGAKARRVVKTTVCANCHRDPHNRRFGSVCNKCHNVFSWRGGVRGKARRTVKAKLNDIQKAALLGITKAQVAAIAFHTKTRYPLTGQHIVTKCEKCHKRRGRRRKKIRRFSRCSHCHKDEHRGQFRRHASLRKAKATRCESCHDTRGFGLTSFTAERHEKSRLALRGAHAAVPCNRCHSTQRPRVRRFTFSRKLDCSTCHKDVHKGRYRLTARSARPLACTTCHQVDGFKPPRFDHDKTKFPLLAKHKRTACASCHKPRGARGIVAFRGLSARCGSCHRSAHAGQFRLRGRVRDCGDCHENGGPVFKIAKFDHAKKTRYVLDGAHAKTQCKQCHEPVKLADARMVARYRPTLISCKSCHQSGHRHLAKRVNKRLAANVRGVLLAAARGKLPGAPRGMAKCERCHVSATAWRAIKAPKRFDHARVGWALEGRHAQAQCKDCHRPGRKASRACVTCHSDRHGGKLGDRCAECHRPKSWKRSTILARHRRTRLPLTGFHALADCASCHPRSRASSYVGAPAACYACHASAYNDPKIHPDHKKAGFDTRCELCHRATGWSPARFTSTTTALTVHRSFALTGKHRAARCVSCHARGRPSKRCESCHAKDAKRARVSHAGWGQRDCGRCHSNTAFRPARLAAHQKRFPLTGKHRGLACGDCHQGRGAAAFKRPTCAGSCHSMATTAQRHRRVSSYLWSSSACLRCHPQGRR
ncbi:MAG: hypothetical protein KC503_13525 [Myxococcales bacterium]|nr:hypothetical protein [Myxococcales bacterium]